MVKYCSVHKNYEHVQYLAFFSYMHHNLMFKDNLRPGCIYIHYVSYKTMGYRKHGFWTKALGYI